MHINQKLLSSRSHLSQCYSSRCIEDALESVVNCIPLKQILKFDNSVHRIVYMRRPIDVGGSICPSLFVPTPVFLSICLSFVCLSLHQFVRLSIRPFLSREKWCFSINDIFYNDVWCGRTLLLVRPIACPSVRPSVYELVHHASIEKMEKLMHWSIWKGPLFPVRLSNGPLIRTDMNQKNR